MSDLMKTPIEMVDVTRSRYDQETYWGRVRHFVDVVDPTTLLVNDEQLKQAGVTIDRVEKRLDGWKDVSVEEFYLAKKRRAAVLHPDTNEPIFLPLRFSAYAPVNLFVLIGMVHPSQQTPMAGMFWQWANQTVNVGSNFANRNISTPVSTQQMLTSYGIAVAVSCAVAFAGQKYVAKMGARAPMLLRFGMPYLSCITANMVNIGVMRSSDYMVGCKVNDKETNEPIEDLKSKKAGISAVAQTALSRSILLPMPLILFPPLLSNFLFKSGKVPFFARRANLRQPIEMGFILTMLLGFLPLCIAIFPQNAVMPVTKLEPEFQNLTNSKGNKITHVSFNKGL